MVKYQRNIIKTIRRLVYVNMEKAIGLLQKMPEHKLEAAYMYIRFIYSQTDRDETVYTPPKAADSLKKRQKGFQGLMTFAGTLPEDFDYEREIEEAREAKYARFI